MNKKIVALAASALFSVNASAGYIQYDLHYGSGNRGLEGFVVQHDTDQSIAFFSFYLSDPVYANGKFGSQFYPFNNEGCVCIFSASTYFRNNGPTNFTIQDGFGYDHATELTVDFARTTQGNFKYTARYSANLYVNEPPELYAGTLTGLATRGTIDPLLVSYLDEFGEYYPGMPRIIPTYIKPNQVPEPTSIALLALGAAGLASIRRRKAVR